MNIGTFLTFFLAEYLNGNGSFNISSIDLLDPPVDGYNFNATITVRNPGVFSIELV